jgi:hypothetical protein
LKIAGSEVSTIGAQQVAASTRLAAPVPPEVQVR